MNQIVYCRDLGFDCNAVVRGNNDAELLQGIARHASSVHDIWEASAEMIEQIKRARRMSVPQTQQVMEAYFDSNHADVSMMAEDVVFTDMTTGQKAKGRAAVLGMLDSFYHQAFDARAETTNVIYGEGTAAVEADFVGQHIGEFAGISATGNEVRVPLCVTYDVRDNQITRARIFMQMPVLMAQITAPEMA